MDLSETWPLEEGTWLSHAGIHHFANTRGGMAAFAVPDTRDPLQLLHPLCRPSCTLYVPSAVCLFTEAAGWRGEGMDFGVRQTCVQMWNFLLISYVALRKSIVSSALT